MDTPTHPSRGVGIASVLTCLLVCTAAPSASRAAVPSNPLAVSSCALATLSPAASTDAALSVPPPCTPHICPRKRVLLIAHRGTGPGTRVIDRQEYSEDTIPAFVEAMRSGANGFETDYWTTYDGRMVSHHDSTLDRMTNGSGLIGGRTWSYLRGVRNNSGAPVPTLRGVERALASYGGRRQQEIKDGAAFSQAALQQFLQIDRAHGRLAGRVLVTSSQLSTLRRVHALAPGVGIGLIDRSATGRPRLSQVPGWVDVLAIDRRAADATYVARARAAGHAVSVRNVNTVLQLHAAVALGVHRVITDVPEVLGRSC